MIIPDLGRRSHLRQKPERLFAVPCKLPRAASLRIKCFSNDKGRPRGCEGGLFWFCALRRLVCLVYRRAIAQRLCLVLGGARIFVLLCEKAFSL